jgi:hypothetical protein
MKTLNLITSTGTVFSNSLAQETTDKQRQDGNWGNTNQRLIISILILLTVFTLHAQTLHPKLKTAMNKNVELLGLAYFISFEGEDIENKTIEIDGKRIAKKDWHRYGYYIFEKYKQFASSENLAGSLAVINDLWLDYLINLLLQLDDFPHAKLLPGIEKSAWINFSKKKDEAEARRNASLFLDGLNKFYKEIDFGKYLDETKSYYETSVKQVDNNLPTYDFIGTMEKFYRRSFESYSLIPSLTIPEGMGFGIKVTTENQTSIFNVFGAFDGQTFQQTEKMDLGFANPQRLRELSIHEFGHSFVNPAVDLIPDAMIVSTEKLFEPLKSAMSRQGYNTWKICLYEHFVRAGEVVIAELSGDKKGAERLRSDYINNRNFKYLPLIISELRNYNNGNKSYSEAVFSIMEELRNENQ